MTNTVGWIIQIFLGILGIAQMIAIIIFEKKKSTQKHSLQRYTVRGDNSSGKKNENEKYKYSKESHIYCICSGDVEGTQEGYLIVLKQGENIFGRDEGCVDFVIADDYISKKHFIIKLSGNEMKILDYNSTNGTYLNGERISHFFYKLQIGDVVSAGNTKFLIIEKNLGIGEKACER